MQASLSKALEDSKVATPQIPVPAPSVPVPTGGAPQNFYNEERVAECINKTLDFVKDEGRLRRFVAGCSSKVSAAILRDLKCKVPKTVGDRHGAILDKFATMDLLSA